MAKWLLSSSEMEEQFPQMYKLLALALTIPVSSVDCERGFSKHNLIKLRLRAGLKTINVSTPMKEFCGHTRNGKVKTYIEHL